jgi:hypothetical protein
MHNAFVQVVEHRPTTRPVQVVPDIVELTVTATLYRSTTAHRKSVQHSPLIRS